VGDIGVLKMLIVLLERGETGREEFRQIARDLYQANYGASCRSLNCYYPEMLP
jgi:hypothetical protein